MKTGIIIIFLLISTFSLSQKTTIPLIDGESCSYRIHYGFITAGKATYSMEFAEYRECPSNIQAEVIKARQEKLASDD